MKTILFAILAFALALQLAMARPKRIQSEVQKSLVTCSLLWPFCNIRHETKSAVALLEGNGVVGTVWFSQTGEGPVTMKGKITGLKQGLHGFHVHEFGDLTNGCNSTRPHFNPKGKTHGGPMGSERHAGDLGNVIADAEGKANVDLRDKLLSLSGPMSIIGRTLEIHADPDDLGMGGNELSKISGNAGAGLACGIIGVAKSQ